MSNNQPIELIVPAEERMMMCVRLTTSGVLARAALPLDAAEDLKLAVEEACNCLIKFSGCSTLHVKYALEAAALNVRICAECRDGQPNVPTKDELYTIRCILQSMVDEVTLSGADCGLCAIALSARTV